MNKKNLPHGLNLGKRGDDDLYGHPWEDGDVSDDDLERELLDMMFPNDDDEDMPDVIGDCANSLWDD